MKTKKYVKIGILVAVAAIFIWTFVFLWQKSRPEVTVYNLATPEVTDLEKTTVATGKVEPRDEVLIKPQISGIIDILYKEAGQTVKKNEVQAETDFARLEALHKDGLISNEEYEKGRVTLQQAREELQAARDNRDIVRDGITKSSADISSTLIRSTIDGLILDVPVKVGNSVIMANTMNDGTTIATVADMNDLIFRGNIDETEVGRVHEGMPVKITIGALQDMTFNASLEYIAPKATEANGANQFEIKAALTVPDTVTIRSGYSANAEIVLEHAKQTLAIPEGAVEFSGDSTFVYVLTDSVGGQQFERRPVEVGMSDGIRIAVKGGITAQDRIRNGEKE